MNGRKLIFFICLLGLTGCKSSLLIEQSESLLSSKSGNVKVICIDPRFYFEDDALNYQLEKCQKITDGIKKDILKFSMKNGIQLELFDLNAKSEQEYYENLLSLKANMLAVNFNQRTPLNFNSRMKENVVQKKVFVYPPKISYEFNSLSKTYGTPYFSFVGIYIVKDELVLYHLVVNTDNSETIYREYKIVNKRAKKELIGQMIYDSYASLAKELKKH